MAGSLCPIPGRRTAPTFRPNGLLYVARLEAHKNHLRLLDACEKLWREGLSFELRLIGCMGLPRYRLAHLAEGPLAAKGGTSRPVAGRMSARPSFPRPTGSAPSPFSPRCWRDLACPSYESLWHGRPVVSGNNGALGEVSAGGGCEIVSTPKARRAWRAACVCFSPMTGVTTSSAPRFSGANSAPGTTIGRNSRSYFRIASGRNPPYKVSS